MLFLIGYFFIMIIFMLIAIVTAKSMTCWLWYVIGAVLQLFSLLGNQKTANINGTDTTLYWLVYIGLLIVTAVFIIKRNNKTSSSSDTDEKK